MASTRAYHLRRAFVRDFLAGYDRFFSIAAYKRRAYLLPLWPTAAVTLAWYVEQLTTQRPNVDTANGWTGAIGRIVGPGITATIAGSILFNFFYLPRKEIHDCGDDSFRVTAAQIDRIVGHDEPLYSFKLGDEPASLIFYLDRDVPPIGGKLGDAPPGYVIAPAEVWAKEQGEALDLTPIFASTSGRPRIVLLRHGPALAFRKSARIVHDFGISDAQLPRLRRCNVLR